METISLFRLQDVDMEQWLSAAREIATLDVIDSDRVVIFRRDSRIYFRKDITAVCELEDEEIRAELDAIEAYIGGSVGCAIDIDYRDIALLKELLLLLLPAIAPAIVDTSFDWIGRWDFFLERLVQESDWDWRADVDISNPNEPREVLC